MGWSCIFAKGGVQGMARVEEKSMNGSIPVITPDDFTTSPSFSNVDIINEPVVTSKEVDGLAL